MMSSRSGEAHLPVVQKTAEDLQNKLEDITELPESDSYPLYHLLPEVLQHWKMLMLLPPELKNFIVDSKCPEKCLKVSKDITVAAYANARALLGDARTVVCIPPKELLQVNSFCTCCFAAHGSVKKQHGYCYSMPLRMLTSVHAEDPRTVGFCPFH